MALTGALCVALTATVGFTNKSPRASVSQLLGRPYTRTKMTYDLRRLRLKGLIVWVHHSNTYVVTDDGIRTAIFYTKLDHRLLHPLLAGHLPPAPPELRQALKTIDSIATSYINTAHLALAA